MQFDQRQLEAEIGQGLGQFVAAEGPEQRLRADWLSSQVDLHKVEIVIAAGLTGLTTLIPELVTAQNPARMHSLQSHSQPVWGVERQSQQPAWVAHVTGQTADLTGQTTHPVPRVKTLIIRPVEVELRDHNDPG